MEVLKKIAEQDENIICCFLYGSRVYGTNNENSDYDFIVVVKDKTINTSLENNGDVTTYSIDEFNELIQQHEISILECLFLAKEFKFKENMKFKFNLDKQLLRNSISSKASNSWVKCKKKFIVEEDYNPYIGKKSLWHSLRILDFGKQIADHGRIVNFDSMNHLIGDIMDLNSWEEIEKKYKSVYNNMASSFKQSAPKNVQFQKQKI